ncbi:DUF547 domain-containing protein [Hyphomonas sp.]|uniref:DUF547 domain-containing protein n=1 Tax=Hyphomonas sp. TaxID=87 RepID=UPI00391B944E
MAKAKHAEWTRLLAAYVRSAEDGVTRVDYAALAANSADRAALDAYIARFAEADLSAKTDANFASWANLYNAVTVRHILERYPVRSIRDGYLNGPWKQVRVRAGGREVSLDAIEHDILRVRWGTPEVHYALNCASYSCPNLPPYAWEPATLEADLARAARDYVNHPRGVTVTARGLTVSSIYSWFEKDFGGSKAAVIEHLLLHAEPGLAASIRANPRINRHTYDWALNDTQATSRR